MAPADIDTIEEYLDIELPGAYRQALLDGVTVNDTEPELYFLQDVKELLILNLELRTLEKQRSFSDADWANEDYCIGEDGCGNYYGIKFDDPDCPVYFFDHETDSYEEIHASLPEFFDSLTDLFRSVYGEGSMFRPAAVPLAQRPPSPDVTVARTDVPRESVLDPISIDEWTAFAESDLDLELRGYRMGINPFTAEKVRFNTPGLAVLKVNNSEQIFNYYCGRITVSQPAQEAIAKLEECAKALNAKVIKGW